jgi:hypothetical protein
METKRQFSTGANRNGNEDKLDYHGFLSPIVFKRYAEYMHKNRHLEDGTMRDGDNWKKGIPKEVYIECGWRHFHDWWMESDGYESREGIEEAICGLMFNCMGYLHETLKEQYDKYIKEQSPLLPREVQQPKSKEKK